MKSQQDHIYILSLNLYQEVKKIEQKVASIGN